MNDVSTFSSICRVCGDPLTTARRLARPNAVECVACLENSGDVPRIRQYTETTRDGEVIATKFVSNPRLERQLQRVQNEVAHEGAFNAAAGDDAALGRPRQALLHTVRIQDVMEE